MLAIWYGALFLPKKDVVIYDITGTTGTYTVANVPIGLAALASATSHIGYWLTKASETVFSLPDDIKFQKTGFMFASRAIVDRANLRFTEPALVQSLTYFTKDCIYPELMRDDQLFKDAIKTADMWGSFNGKMNAGRMVNVYDDVSRSYQNMDCASAYTTLTRQMNANITNDLIPTLGKALNPAVPLANVSALVASQLPTTDNYILGIATTAEDTIRQAATANLLADSQQFVPQMLGDSAAATTALATAIAQTSATSAYQTLAKVAESSLPIIRNAINVLTLAVFPIIILVIIMAGAAGGIVFRTYAMALFWVQLWAPLYAAVNFFMTWWGHYGAQAAGGTAHPLSFAAMNSLTNSMSSEQAVAGILVISVPVIAYMLVNRGSAAFTSVVSGVMAPSTTAAQSAGSQVGQGNTQVGNTSWGNVQMHNRSANQWNTAPTYTWGAATSTQVMPDGSRINTFAGGGGTLDRRPTVSDLGDVSAMAGAGVAYQAQTLSKDSYQQAAQAVGTISNSLSAAYDTAKTFLQSSGNSTRVGTNAAINNMAQFASHYANAMNIASKWNAAISLTDAEKQQLLKEVSLNFGAGIPGGTMSPLSFGMKATLAQKVSSESQLQSLLESARSYAENSGFTDELNKAQGFSHAITTDTGSESTKRAAREIKAHLSDAEQASYVLSSSLSSAHAYETVASEAKSGDARAQANLADYIIHKLGGPERAAAVLSSLDTGRRQELVDGYVRQYVEERANLIKQGDPGKNAGVAIQAIGATPQEDPRALYTQGSGHVEQKFNHDDKKVPGNPGAAPSVIVDTDGKGGNPGVRITPDTVLRAEHAGTEAAAQGVGDGRGDAGVGRKTVVAPVQDEQKDPHLLERAARTVLGVDPPKDRNPAGKPRNTGGADGEW
jgi:conjugal transfer mating pair stabilization protein TraG